MMRKSHHHHDSHNDEHVNQEKKVSELRAAIGPISGRSLQYCTDACLRRYLEARNWSVDKSKKMLEETLRWRAAYRPEEIRWHEIAGEGETGKVYKADFHDLEGRTVLVLKPGKQNTSSHDNQMRHLVYLIENAILNLPKGQEQMVWLIDFTGWSLTKAVSMKTTKETAHILQSHYPERLFSAYLYSPRGSSKPSGRFIYPKNEESMELMRRSFDAATLPAEFGGESTSQYDHEEFSRLMAKDDIRSTDFWGAADAEQEKHACNGYSSSEVAPEPAAAAGHGS
ncbi:unnamed protein product [Spirodela intermedia]|uniref:CRAL-TRIO domain-containing protein n=1 Tax=Spirodela intermedia TaxID=51605 RepID=A0A7I8JDH2_SPIIN|nr:unnamed protein product [Spirodela intermedia]CAA6667442.1 unnamed protein product [Spirodela intermedia]